MLVPDATAMSSLFADMQAYMESLRHNCEREFDSEFDGGRAGTFPNCGMYVISNLSRHIIDFHLELGQLWRCPVGWCSVWKGTAHDCIDHLRGKHNETENAGESSFPLGSDSGDCVALHPEVSVVATDVQLFHQCGRRSVHGYRMYKDPLPRVPGGPVNQEMAVARLTSLHLSIPLSGTTSTPVRLDSAPVTPAPLEQPLRNTASVSFASDLEVIEYMPVWSFRMDETGSPDLLQPAREFSIPTPGVTYQTRFRQWLQ